MDVSHFQRDDYFRTVLDVLPISIFVVDNKFRISDMNRAATDLLGIDSKIALRRLCGEIMHCLHAIESEDGCGTTEYCPDCVIRNSVESAGEGTAVHRNKYQMKIQKGKKTVVVHMLVTAAPFNYEGNKLVLLALEDITEIINLKRLLPTCANCNKIRNNEGYWEEITDYLSAHAELEFSHGICPECAHKLYPDLGF